MIDKKLIKIFFKNFPLLLFFALISCSNNKSIFSKSTVDPYIINKKTPLIMPPDMMLRPPGEEIRKKEEIEINSSAGYFNQEDLSVDDILFDNKSIVKKEKSLSPNKIISDILKTKAKAILN